MISVHIPERTEQSQCGWERDSREGFLVEEALTLDHFLLKVQGKRGQSGSGMDAIKPRLGSL